MAMLRSLKARGQRPDIVHIHSAPSAESVIFHNELRELEATQPGYRLHLQLTHEDGKVDFENLDHLVSDWTFAHCVFSPTPMGVQTPCDLKAGSASNTPAFLTRDHWSADPFHWSPLTDNLQE